MCFGIARHYYASGSDIQLSSGFFSLLALQFHAQYVRALFMVSKHNLTLYQQGVILYLDPPSVQSILIMD